MTDFSYPVACRIRRASEYHVFFKQASAIDGRYFRLYFVDKKGAFPRFGIIASRKGVGSAVSRNRCKRLLRELIRGSSELKNTSKDYVFVAKRSLLGAKLPELQVALPTVLKRIGQ